MVMAMVMMVLWQCCSDHGGSEADRGDDGELRPHPTPPPPYGIDNGVKGVNGVNDLTSPPLQAREFIDNMNYDYLEDLKEREEDDW